MTRAAIFVGSELRFHEQAKTLEEYLLHEVGMRRHTVSIVPCWNKEPDDVLWTIGLHSAKANRQPLLLAYLGHGFESGWSYGYRSKWQPLQIGYDAIGEKLREHRGPLLVVNECCHAGRIQDQMTWINSDKVPVGVLAACDASETSYGAMLPDIIALWRSRKPYTPVVRRLAARKDHEEQRWGAMLDHHFFAKPA